MTNAEPTLQVPIDCLYSIPEVFNGEYEMPTLPEYVTMPHVVDIGANIGMYPVWLRKFYRNAQFACYEPNPSLIPMLTHNMSLIGGVSVVDSAVGDPKIASFSHGKDTRLCGSQYVGERTGGQFVPVKVLAPEDLPDCDLMKIDAEGAEGYICEHLKFTPLQLVVECHSDALAARVNAALSPKMALGATIPT